MLVKRSVADVDSLRTPLAGNLSHRIKSANYFCNTAWLVKPGYTCKYNANNSLSYPCCFPLSLPITLVSSALSTCIYYIACNIIMRCGTLIYSCVIIILFHAGIAQVVPVSEGMLAQEEGVPTHSTLPGKEAAQSPGHGKSGPAHTKPVLYHQTHLWLVDSSMRDFSTAGHWC